MHTRATSEETIPQILITTATAGAATDSQSQPHLLLLLLSRHSMAADKDSLIAGVATTVTLVGEALTNGEYTSICEVVTKAGDVVATAAPESITAGAMTCNLPALDAGNYMLRAKKDDVVSNPVAVKCVPGVAIDSVDCADGVLTISRFRFWRCSSCRRRRVHQCQTGCRHRRDPQLE